MAHSVDVSVGKRVRLRRVQVDVSQADLAKAVGVSFQQIQKYEKGTNRISCSRLSEIAKVLRVPIIYFFSGTPSKEKESSLLDQLETEHVKEGAQLLEAYFQIKNPKVRRNAISLLKSIAFPEAD